MLAHSISRDIPLGEGKSNLRLNENSFRIVLEKGLKGLSEIRGDPKIWDHRREEDERLDIQRVEDFGSMDGDSSRVSGHAVERGKSQLGTLGGGNHFCEIQYVEKVFDEKLASRFGIRENQILIMLHSGSRGFGHQVAGDYMKEAKRLTSGSSPAHDLCYLPLDHRKGRDYIKAMHCAANFAYANRQIMTIMIRKNVRHYFKDLAMPIIYDVTHNMAKKEVYDGKEYWVHRKGATRAFSKERMQGTPFADVGQPVLIPGSMGTGSYLLIGTESARATFFSVNHGAGRVMSRSAATGRYRKRGGRPLRQAAISDEAFRKSMEGIKLIAANRALVKEEAPQAYKDIDEVVDIVAEAGLAKPVARMKPLAVMKG
jgi:tRNA-splicing ligase RtcB